MAFLGVQEITESQMVALNTILTYTKFKPEQNAPLDEANHYRQSPKQIQIGVSWFLIERSVRSCSQALHEGEGKEQRCR